MTWPSEYLGWASNTKRALQLVSCLQLQRQRVGCGGGAAHPGVPAEPRPYQVDGVQLVHAHPPRGHGDQGGQADADDRQQQAADDRHHHCPVLREVGRGLDARE